MSAAATSPWSAALCYALCYVPNEDSTAKTLHFSFSIASRVWIHKDWMEMHRLATIARVRHQLHKIADGASDGLYMRGPLLPYQDVFIEMDPALDCSCPICVKTYPKSPGDHTICDAPMVVEACSKVLEVAKALQQRMVDTKSGQPRASLEAYRIEFMKAYLSDLALRQAFDKAQVMATNPERTAQVIYLYGIVGLEYDVMFETLATLYTSREWMACDAISKGFIAFLAWNMEGWMIVWMGASDQHSKACMVVVPRTFEHITQYVEVGVPSFLAQSLVQLHKQAIARISTNPGAGALRVFPISEKNKANKHGLDLRTIDSNIMKSKEAFEKILQTEVFRCGNDKCTKPTSKGKRVDFKQCTACKRALYCDQECQKIDWKAKHKKECAEMKEANAKTKQVDPPTKSHCMVHGVGKCPC